MSAAFFSLRRTDWELRPATTTRRACTAASCSPRAGSQLWRGGGVALRTGRTHAASQAVRRAAKRIGEERVAEARQAAVEYGQLPPRAATKSGRTSAPRWSACRWTAVASNFENGLQPNWIRRRRNPTTTVFGREYKAGVLLSMKSEVYLKDPCPDLPATFADPGKMREIAREIKGFTSDSQVSIKADEAAGPDFKEPLRWPPGNIGQKRSGHERRRGCVWAVAGPRGLRSRLPRSSAESVCRRRLADKLGSVAVATSPTMC